MIRGVTARHTVATAHSTRLPGRLTGRLAVSAGERLPIPSSSSQQHECARVCVCVSVRESPVDLLVSLSVCVPQIPARSARRHPVTPVTPVGPHRPGDSGQTAPGQYTAHIAAARYSRPGSLPAAAAAADTQCGVA